MIKTEVDRCDTLIVLSYPKPITERGVTMDFATFCVAVMVNVVAYFICKWLDSDDNDN